MSDSLRIPLTELHCSSPDVHIQMTRAARRSFYRIRNSDFAHRTAAASVPKSVQHFFRQGELVCFPTSCSNEEGTTQNAFKVVPPSLQVAGGWEVAFRKEFSHPKARPPLLPSLPGSVPYNGISVMRQFPSFEGGNLVSKWLTFLPYLIFS